MRERGPYVFRETREKEIIEWQNHSEILAYHDIKKFYFEPSLSAGSLDDEVSVINAPLVVSIITYPSRVRLLLTV